MLDPKWTPKLGTRTPSNRPDWETRIATRAYRHILRILKPPATERLEIWDTREPGLLLRVTAGGTFTWSARARTDDGKRTRVTLGTYPKLTLADARRRAKAVIVRIHDGADPIAEKQAKQAARIARASLPKVGARLTEWREAKAARWSDAHQYDTRRICNIEIVPVLGDRILAETTRTDWVKMIDAIRKRGAPSVATAVYRCASAFLSHAEAHAWIAAHPLPRKGLQTIAPPPRSRDRILSDDELRQLWRAIDELGAKPRLFVMLLLLTACRASEAAAIAVGELDLAAATWTVPGSRQKHRRDRTPPPDITRPLPAVVSDGLRAIMPAHAAGPRWRLLGQTKGGALSGFSKIKASLDQMTASRTGSSTI